MTGRKSEHEALAKQRRDVETLRKPFARGHDGDVDFARLEQVRQPVWNTFDKLELDASVPAVEVSQQTGKAAGSDCAHDADLEICVLKAKETRGFLAHARQFVEHLLEPRPQQCSEIRNVREISLAAEQQSPDFVLELLDRAAQRRLGHVASLCRAREVAGLADGQEITNVVHVHGPLLARRRALRPMQTAYAFDA
jgi:hypothetical protein